MSNIKGNRNLLLAEIGQGEDIDGDGNSGGSDDNDQESEFDYDCPQISEETANLLYSESGKEEKEVNNSMIVHPSPHVLTSVEEQTIMKAKLDLYIRHELDNFQIQALVSLLNNRNVVLIAPCGSGKMLVYHLAVHIMRIKLNKPKGVGLCLQPFNNILYEKQTISPQ